MIVTMIAINGCSLTPEMVNDDASVQYSPPLSKLSVIGNKLVNEQGRQVRLKGLNPIDPLIHKQLGDSGCPEWGKLYFDTMKQWGANVVRLSIHPAVWKYHGDSDTFAALDEALSWCEDNDMYAIIDFHSIGFPTRDTYKNDSDAIYGNKYQTTTTDMKQFWQKISERYRGQKVVAAYELFNEPTISPNGGSPGGQSDWLELKNFAEEIITEIRNNDSQTIILVGGLNWAYDLSHVALHPVSGNQIAYAVHPYPDKTNWDSNFGLISNSYPVIVTEFGYGPAGGGYHFDKDNYSGTDYGTDIIDYLDSKAISWIAWSFSASWLPKLLADTNYTPSDSGSFFKEKLSN